MIPSTTTSREERINALIADYLDREAAGRLPPRAEWLAEHADCADELRRFLDEHERMGRLGSPLRALAAPALGNDAVTIGGATANTTQVPPPVVRCFGDYELLAEIARGGMGVVYKAHQKSLNRPVALKMILAGQLASPIDVQRFRTEAAAAGQLDHPNIVPVYDVDEHEGQHYFSMKLIDGDSLARAIAADRWPRRTHEGQTAIARLLVQTARAVHYAHQRGILHRDLKPGNILLDSRNDPHVTDFGLAKRVGGDSSMTNTGAVVGTPAYMPPEQAAGNKQLTIAADVYSLGAILFELLTGRPPFTGESALSILSQVSADEPSRPRSLNPALDRDLETVCLKCLEKDPNRRYGSAEALADDLDRWLNGEPIEARSATSWERTLKWAKRRPAVAGLVGVSVASAAALLIVGLVFNAQLGFAIERVNQQEKDLKQAKGDVVQARKDVAKEQADLKAANERAGQFLDDVKSLRLVYRAEAERAADPALALLLAIEANRFERRGADHNRALAAALMDCRELGPLLRLGTGHGISKVRYFADGRRVLTVDYHTVRIWDAKSGNQLVEFSGPQLRIGALALSPDDRWIALAFQEYAEYGVIKVNGKQLNKEFLVTDQAVRIYDAETGREVHVLKGHEHRVVSVSFSPDSKRLVTAAPDRTARIWDVQTGTQMQVLKGHECGLASAAYTKEGQVLTVSSGIKQGNADNRPPFQQYLERVPPEDIDPPLPQSFEVLSSSSGSSRSWGGHHAGESMFACLWNPETGGKVFEFRSDRHGELGTPRAATLSPDGRYLLAALPDGAAIFDRQATKQEVHAFRVRDELLYGAAPQFSPDGKRALLAFHRSVRIWEVATGLELATLRSQDGVFTSARFSVDPEGRHVLTTCEDGTARLWEATTGRELFRLRGHEQEVNAADFHPSGRQIVTGSHDGTVRFWNGALNNGYERIIDEDSRAWWIGAEGYTPEAFKKHRKAIWSATFTAGGKRVAAGYFDGVFRLWDAASGKLVAERAGYEKLANSKLRKAIAHEIFAIASNQDGTRVLVVAADAVAKLQNAPGSLSASKSAGVPFFPVRIYDTTTGDEVAALEGLSAGVRSARFSPDGAYILTVADNVANRLIVDKAGNQRGSGSGGSDEDRSARIFDAKTGKLLRYLADDWKEIFSACWDAKSERFATFHECFVFGKRGDAPGIRIWDVRSGQQTHKLIDEHNDCNAGAFSPDGRRLVTWHDSRIRSNSSRGGTRETRVWDLASGKVLFTLKNPRSTNSHAAYSPDGKYIVTTAHVYNRSTSSGPLGLHGRLRDMNDVDRSARIWDAETGALVAVLHGHAQSVHHAEFSSDSKWLVTCSEDRTARVWEVSSGNEFITLRGHDDEVKTAQFSPDGKTVLTVSWDGSARLWPVDPLPIAQQRRPRELTDDEKERFDIRKNP